MPPELIETLDIRIASDEPLATIRIWVSPPGTWDTSPTDLTQLKIDYATALQMADAAGGAEYKAGHSTCFQRVVLTENQWNFGYLEDSWEQSDDVLHLCMDGITGEPCEYWLPDDPPPKDEKLPPDIARAPISRILASSLFVAFPHDQANRLGCFHDLCSRDPNVVFGQHWLGEDL